VKNADLGNRSWCHRAYFGDEVGAVRDWMIVDRDDDVT
jgi:hypothetical protein